MSVLEFLASHLRSPASGSRFPPRLFPPLPAESLCPPRTPTRPIGAQQFSQPRGPSCLSSPWFARGDFLFVFSSLLFVALKPISPKPPAPERARLFRGRRLPRTAPALPAAPQAGAPTLPARPAACVRSPEEASPEFIDAPISVV